MINIRITHDQFNNLAFPRRFWTSIPFFDIKQLCDIHLGFKLIIFILTRNLDVCIESLYILYEDLIKILEQSAKENWLYELTEEDLDNPIF